MTTRSSAKRSRSAYTPVAESSYLFDVCVCTSVLTSMHILFRLPPVDAAMIPFLSKTTLKRFSENYVFRELLQYVYPYASVPDAMIDCVRLFRWLTQLRPFDVDCRFWLDGRGCAVKLDNKHCVSVCTQWPLGKWCKYERIDDEPELVAQCRKTEIEQRRADLHQHTHNDTLCPLFCAACVRRIHERLRSDIRGRGDWRAFFAANAAVAPAGFALGSTSLFACRPTYGYPQARELDANDGADYDENKFIHVFNPDCSIVPMSIGNVGGVVDDRGVFACPVLIAIVDYAYAMQDGHVDNSALLALTPHGESLAIGWPDGPRELYEPIAVYFAGTRRRASADELLSTDRLAFRLFARELVCCGYDHVTHTAYLVHRRSVTVVDLYDDKRITVNAHLWSARAQHLLGSRWSNMYAELDVKISGSLMVFINTAARIVTADLRNINEQNEIDVNCYCLPKVRGRNMVPSYAHNNGSLLLSINGTSSSHYPQFASRRAPWEKHHEDLQRTKYVSKHRNNEITL